MGPWIDRRILERNAKKFAQSHGFFLRKNGHRISSLVEIAVYNSIVEYYQTCGFLVSGENLGPKKSFRYKLTASGLTENHSFFIARREAVSFQILHNMRIQSAHHDHLYFTADVCVTGEKGATTQKLQSGRRHSFVAKKNLITFVEVKHLVPFPEVLFSFMGLVLEFMPGLIDKTLLVTNSGDRLCPIIVFTGPGSDHTDLIKQSLSDRYGINIIFGTSSSFGSVSGLGRMKKYGAKEKPGVYMLPRPGRRLICLED